MSEETWYEDVARVRPDLIEELCFADHFRRPLTRDHYDRLKSFMPREDYELLPGFDRINELRANFKDPTRVVLTFFRDSKPERPGWVLISEGPYLRRIRKPYEGLLQMIYEQVIAMNAWQGTVVHRGLFYSTVPSKQGAQFSLGYQSGTGYCYLIETREIPGFINLADPKPASPVGFAYRTPGHVEMLDPRFNDDPWDDV